MTDEVVDVVVESKATPEQQTAAEEMGWIPATRYKGDAERFVDADEYIKRGETVLPIVKEQNKRLKSELDSVRAANTVNSAALAKAQEAIAAIEERHTIETQRAVDRAKAEVKAQLRAASEAGDHEGIAELTEQLVELNTAKEEAAAKPVQRAAPVVAIDPELIEWQKDNTWYGSDKRRTALALGIADDLRGAGDRSAGITFYNKIAAEVEKEMPMKKVREVPASKVEESGRTSEAGRVSARGKSYADLPADARAACDADAKRFVGSGKRYADATAWRQQYVSVYFQGE